MFEVIQRDGQVLRFDDNHYWRHHNEDDIDERTIIDVYQRTPSMSDEDILVTTVFRPLRVDSVTEHTALNPHFKTLIGTKCRRCGHLEP